MKYLDYFDIFVPTLFVLVWLSLPTTVFSFDVDGDGKEGLAESIHALQVSAGVIPTEPATGDALPEDVLRGHSFSNSEETGLTGTRFPAPVPKLGNEMSEMGVEWPNPRFTGNDIFGYLDNLTGLHWALPENYSGIGGNHINMSGYCDNLIMGLTPVILNDWRLPNLRELLSLIDYTEVSPALPSDHPFGSIDTTKNYWTSTLVGVSFAYWTVDFAVGYTEAKDYFSEKIYVWCVRDSN